MTALPLLEQQHGALFQLTPIKSTSSQHTAHYTLHHGHTAEPPSASPHVCECSFSRIWVEPPVTTSQQDQSDKQQCESPNSKKRHMRSICTNSLLGSRSIPRPWWGVCCSPGCRFCDKDDSQHYKHNKTHHIFDPGNGYPIYVGLNYNISILF